MYKGQEESRVRITEILGLVAHSIMSFLGRQKQRVQSKLEASQSYIVKLFKQTRITKSITRKETLRKKVEKDECLQLLVRRVGPFLNKMLMVRCREPRKRTANTKGLGNSSPIIPSPLVLPVITTTWVQIILSSNTGQQIFRSITWGLNNKGNTQSAHDQKSVPQLARHQFSFPTFTMSSPALAMPPEPCQSKECYLTFLLPLRPCQVRDSRLHLTPITSIPKSPFPKPYTQQSI